MFFYKKTIYVVETFFDFGFADILSLMTCLIKEIMRSIDIFDVAINMSGLMIKNDDDE